MRGTVYGILSLLGGFLIAVLCLIGVYSHWLFSAYLAAALLTGGVTGRIVVGTALGFVQGAVFGIQFFFLTAVALVLLVHLLLSPWDRGLWMMVVCGIAVLVGGVLGGLNARPRSRR